MDFSVRRILIHRFWRYPCALALLALLSAPATFGSISSIRLNRFETHQTDRGTRILFKLVSTPEHSLVQLPDQRLRLVLRGCDAGFLSRLRGYGDRHIEKVQVSRRGDDLIISFTLKNPSDGYRLHSEPGSGIVTLDIGPGMRPLQTTKIPPGRDAIWAGAERLIREFSPPLKSDIPFTPVNRTPIMGLMNPEEARIFQ